MKCVDLRCPSCGSVMSVSENRSEATCRYCGNKFLFDEGKKAIEVNGIVTFDALLLSAQQAVEFDNDFDLARKKYREALTLKPNDYRCLWGIYLCEVDMITYYNNVKGFIQYPGDIPTSFQDALSRFGNRAEINAPPEIAEYYRKIIDNDKEKFLYPQKKKKGCYIATSVYGSYNCPEVWVLRRYRDEKLANSFCGRMFIKLYYTFSPILIKMFGKTIAFNNFFKKRLDKKVSKLKNKGFDNTPYNDKLK